MLSQGSLGAYSVVPRSWLEASSVMRGSAEGGRGGEYLVRLTGRAEW